LSTQQPSQRAGLWVVIPAYNEAPRIAAVLGGIARALPSAQRVVVDDGSADDTRGVAHAAGARVLRHGTNLGYGAALQTAYKAALRGGAEVVIQLDADGQHDPECLPALLDTLDTSGADLVIGSRFAAPSTYEMGFSRSLGRRLFVRLAGAVGLAITDPTSGLQVLRRPMLELYARDFFPADYPDVDVLLVAHRRGLRIVEHAVEMHAATRASLLHGGTRSFYYLYRLGLALWAGTGRRE